RFLRNILEFYYLDVRISPRSENWFNGHPYPPLDQPDARIGIGGMVDHPGEEAGIGTYGFNDAHVQYPFRFWGKDEGFPGELGDGSKVFRVQNMVRGQDKGKVVPDQDLAPNFRRDGRIWGNTDVDFPGFQGLDLLDVVHFNQAGLQVWKPLVD